MGSVDQLRAAREAYIEATIRYAKVVAAVHGRIRQGKRPKPADFQREEDAKVILAAAKALYIELNGQA